MAEEIHGFTADDAAPEGIRGQRIVRLLIDDVSVGTAVVANDSPEALAEALASIRGGETLEKRAKAAAEAKLRAAKERRESEAKTRRAKRKGPRLDGRRGVL